MSIKKRIVQTGAVLALSGAFAMSTQADIEASAAWAPRTVSQIESEIQTQFNNQSDSSAVEYTFKHGDTLWGISQATGVSTSKLAQVNEIQNSSLIIAGNSIYLNENNSVVSVEDNGEVESYDVSGQDVHKTETPEEVEEEAAQDSEVQEEQSNESAEQEAAEQRAEEAAEQLTADAAEQETDEEADVEENETEDQESNEPVNENNSNDSNELNDNSDDTSERTVHTSTTTTVEETNNNEQPEPNVNNGSVLDIAHNYSGATYVYGGSTPAGFDCSGYVQYVFQQAGQSVPRTTTAQYSASTNISRAEAQAGDLVFFSQGSSVDHVGIYLGNGQFIGAQTSTGVAVSTIDSGYWAQHVAGFGRF